MTRATEDQLAALHKRVAESFVNALDQSTEASRLLEVERDVPLPVDVVSFLEELTTVHPSLLTAATKFLKDNNISCSPGESADLNRLAKQLQDKRQVGKGSVLKIPLTD